MEEASGVALVTTAWLRSSESSSRHVQVLNAFLLYHTAIGVDRIFVFLDGDATKQPRVDALHGDVRALVAQGRIELFHRELHGNRGCVSLSSGVALQYADCLNYEKLQAGLRDGGDVSSRQMLHAEMAMMRCVQLNGNSSSTTPQRIRWLLHLDIDELFYCEGFASTEKAPEVVLKEWISMLDHATEPLNQLTIVNYEAVPTSLSGGNYFVSTTKFRRHTSRIPLSTESQKALRAWQERSPYNQYFLFYDNGKSIVRVPTSSDAPTMIPASVHHWRYAEDSGRGRSVSNFYDPRRADASVWNEPQRHLRSCVLHYPVCGLEWLDEKYERLGAFPEVWGGATNLKIHPCFHLQARDASCSLQDRESALQTLFRDQVMIHGTNHSFWENQMSSGVCEEIVFARELLMSRGFASLSAETTSTKSHAQSPTKRVDTTPPAAREDTAAFTVEKAWMLAAISDQYLQ